ncbi:MAG: cellobiose phosphorylase [bacterium]
MTAKKRSGEDSGKTGNKPLWHFSSGTDISFEAPQADHTSRLYFPLMNEGGMKSWVSPELKGYICKDFGHYLTTPTVTEEIHRTVSSRNGWVSIKGKQPWSITGMSAWQKANKWSNPEKSTVRAHPGLFQVFRQNDEMRISAESTVFIPSGKDHVELMLVEIQNRNTEAVDLDFTYALPIFGRHADNFRDHRQVTTMFQRNFTIPQGVRVKPNIVHDEHGHAPNEMNYFIAAADGNGNAPEKTWITMKDFIGEGGTLDNPEAVFKKLDPPDYKEGEVDGKEAIGAFRFAPVTLRGGETIRYIIIHGISENPGDIETWIEKYGQYDRLAESLKKTEKWWDEYIHSINIQSGDPTFDKWSSWVIYQIKSRQVFGNSYLPDFGYGRGGRGWRDLWQDLLSIFLVDPESARDEILNSFKGVRIDGSNATIIGTKPGEFIADRNNVPRSWCDHGAWPAFVIDFYLQQTNDHQILFEPLPYWKDQFTSRSKVIDMQWDHHSGNWQRDENEKLYKGNLFEHILIQQLSAFFHVGEHNILLLEGADWNDTYDMARDRGESVGFYAFYGRNLSRLALLLSHLKRMGIEKVELLEEVTLLLDRLPEKTIVDYDDPKAKQDRLNSYFEKVRKQVSGKKIPVKMDDLIADLREKSDHISSLLRDQEWITVEKGEGFFNGHYDNLGQAIDGINDKEIQMDLTTQVMTIMHKVSTESQTAAIMRAAENVLRDENGLGYRLCRPFREIDLNIGRLTGFVYGYKEHGSKWMQQNIMLSYGLFSQGFSQLAFDVISQVYRLCADSGTSRIFPGVPSYFEPGDRGAYAYLTGSSSWLILTITTQLFGIRGNFGNLLIEPQLPENMFDDHGNAGISCSFRGMRLHVEYWIEDNNPSPAYTIKAIRINDKTPQFDLISPGAAEVNFDELSRLCTKSLNEIKIKLN